MATSPSEKAWMARAARLALRGLGGTYPNPSVGALIVDRRGALVAQGRTRPTGGAHAEVMALRRAGARTRGADMFVTLEPCAHHGRTPPCVDAIVDAGIRRVYVGVRDPAAHVAGKGIRTLRRRGVEVVELHVPAVMAAHEHYLHHVTHGRPFVTLKTAASLDGCIATATGDSKWITGDRARREGHRLRAFHHAIAVGAQTVLADDPALTVRLCRGVDPHVVVFDPDLRTLMRRKTPQVLRAGTIVLHRGAVDAALRLRARNLQVELVRVRSRAGRLRIDAALDELGRRDLRSLLVEGGGRLVGAFAEAQLWQRWAWFTAPRVLGAGVPAVASAAWRAVGDAPELTLERERRLGADTLRVWRP